MSDAVGSISHIQQQAADWLNNSDDEEDDEEDDEDIERIAKDAHEVVHQIIYGVGHN